MNTRSLEECKKILKKGDKDTLERRAERLQEIKPIQTNGRQFSSQREWDYAGEASDTYINGNYRSAIFCCACAIDQIFRYEYIKVSGHKYEDLERCTFGQIIRKCKEKNVTTLRPFTEKAELLNHMRNDVAAHPLFIDLPAKSDLASQARNELVCRDIIALLDLVEKIDPNLRQEIESTRLISEVEGRTYILSEVITGQSEIPFNLDGFWGLIERDILRFLGSQAWSIVKAISEDLYGVD